MKAPPLMQLRDLRKSYRLRQSLLQRLRGQGRTVDAVDGVSLEIQPGSILGLVGESGCGKSTLAQMIVGLSPPTGGDILWHGTNLAELTREGRRAYRAGVQMVFQDTHSSLNPRKRIRTILEEALAARGLPRAARPARIDDLLRQVGIDAQLLGRYPHELSGGQRQRIGIARSLAMEPSLLVADEPVSSLDVSLQGQIINLLRDLNATLGLTLVLISHDLAVVARVCDRVAVMYGGRVVESGSPDTVLDAPAHPYTQALLDAVPRGLERRNRARAVLPVEAGESRGGCHFRRRCPRAMAVCATSDPALLTVGLRHEAACHLHDPANSQRPDGPQRSGELPISADVTRTGQPGMPGDAPPSGNWPQVGDPPPSGHSHDDPQRADQSSPSGHPQSVGHSQSADHPLSVGHSQSADYPQSVGHSQSADYPQSVGHSQSANDPSPPVHPQPAGHSQSANDPSPSGHPQPAGHSQRTGDLQRAGSQPSGNTP